MSRRADKGSDSAPLMEPKEAAFLDSRRVAYLATADRQGAPHVVPVCFVCSGGRIYITIDEKPKCGVDLKRLRNIAENPSVALTVERYDDLDWSKLGWLMIRGQAVVLRDGKEHDAAQERLRAKYRQLRNMQLESLPVIAIQMKKIASWGDLAPTP